MIRRRSLCIGAAALATAGVGPGCDDGNDCEPEETGPPAPELLGASVWLNADEPLFLANLRGQVVLLDFWTYGCANCIHVLPEFRKLEEAFRSEPLVVIGIHSGNFVHERDAKSIRAAMQIYDVRHPVAVDSEFAIWDAYGVSAYPTLALIDAAGRLRHTQKGEWVPEVLSGRIDTLIAEARCEGIAAEPLDYLRAPSAGDDTPLRFPAKVLALGDGRIAVADTGHHRIVIARDDGTVDDIFGAGSLGQHDGVGVAATFARPRGMAWYQGRLYVADAENHVIRRIDLDAREVVTVAGTGVKGQRWYTIEDGWVEAAGAELRSPWDLQVVDGGLIVAMAGIHQLFFYDPAAERLRVFSGSGYEGKDDGPAAECTFAQPSALSLSEDGATLFVADSESSSIRAVSVNDGSTVSLVGRGLNWSGDKNGVGDEVLLAHPEGLETLAGGDLVVADTYNSKLKLLSPATRETSTLDWLADGLTLNEPRSITREGDILYIADTNHHRLLRRDQLAGETTVFELPDLTAPASG